MSQSVKMTNKTKYMALHINFLRQELNNKTIQLKFIALTKPLTAELSDKYRNLILYGFNNKEVLDEENIFLLANGGLMEALNEDIIV